MLASDRPLAAHYLASLSFFNSPRNVLPSPCNPLPSNPSPTLSPSSCQTKTRFHVDIRHKMARPNSVTRNRLSSLQADPRGCCERGTGRMQSYYSLPGNGGQHVASRLPTAGPELMLAVKPVARSSLSACLREGKREGERSNHILFYFILLLPCRQQLLT